MALRRRQFFVPYAKKKNKGQKRGLASQGYNLSPHYTVVHQGMIHAQCGFEPNENVF